MSSRKYSYYLLVSGFLLLLMGLLLPVTAQEETAEPVLEATEEAAPPSQPLPDGAAESDDNYCVICHAGADQVHTLSDGTQIDLQVNPEDLAQSVHGTDNPEGALSCTDCHGEDAFPHDGKLPASERVLAVQSIEMCSQCHTEQATELADGVHAAGLVHGNLRAATCADCHGSHDIQSLKDQPQAVAAICGSCHVSVYDEYQESVHGQALLVKNDTNAPACTDCHGVHGINNPTTAQARNRSPELCASCHADEDLMAEYDISTHVFDTYLSEFHGTTVALFDQQDPNVASNKAVCFDCHGVHNILPADNEKSQVAKENLLITCQQCHPNATTNFPDAWVGHFKPTAEENPVFFAVQWFYRLLIPMVLGGFAIMVASDIFGRLRRRATNSEGTHHG